MSFKKQFKSELTNKFFKIMFNMFTGFTLLSDVAALIASSQALANLYRPRWPFPQLFSYFAQTREVSGRIGDVFPLTDGARYNDATSSLKHLFD